MSSPSRSISRRVYVCSGADVDEYSYASLYIPNLPFSVQAFIPLSFVSPGDRGHVHQTDKANNEFPSLFSLSLSLSLVMYTFRITFLE